MFLASLPKICHLAPSPNKQLDKKHDTQGNHKNGHDTFIRDTDSNHVDAEVGNKLNLPDRTHVDYVNISTANIIKVRPYT